MTFPDDRDRSLEELLRSSLSAEADAVTPRGDGLTRIQHRVSSRRRRRAWLRPVAAVGAVAVVGGAAFTTYAVTHHPGTGDDRVVVGDGGASPTPTAGGSPTPTTSSTTPTAAPVYPPAAFFPFTSAAAERSWEAGGTTSQPAYTDAVATAKAFTRDFVGAGNVSLVISSDVKTDSATVTLGRTFSDGASQRPWPVTAVRLQKYGAAWLVVGADDAKGLLTVTSPSAGASVTSPVTVTGPAYGVDEAVRAEVRGTAGSLTVKPGHASFGNGSAPWSTTVSFAAGSARVGAVVVTEDSAADGAVARIAAVGVHFGSSTVGAYPPYFYGVKNGRVTKFSARDGASVAYLTTGTPAASDPQHVGGLVYFISADGTCASSLKAVPASGDGVAVRTVATAASGYVIVGYGLTADGTQVALWETACHPSGSKPQGLLVSTVRASHRSHAIQFPSFPPMVTGDPVWAPDGTHVYAAVRTGNLAGVQRFDAFGASSVNDGQPACGRTDWGTVGLPQSVAIDGNGELYVAAESAGGLRVVRCTSGSTPHPMFTVDGAVGAGDLAVTADGSAVLASDGSGSVWRWSGGATTDITPRVPQPQVAW